MLVTYEEKIFSLYSVPPLKLIGLEGMWGLIISIIVLAVFQNIECTGSLCSNGRLEDSYLAIQEILLNKPIQIMTVLIVVALIGCYYSGIMITKLGSSV